jgi:hypothetical protein
MFQGKYDAAREPCREALQLDPGYDIAQFPLGWTDVEAGKFKEAIPELEKAKAMASESFIVSVSSFAYAYAKSGDCTKAEAMIAELNQMSSLQFVSPYCTPQVYLGLGAPDRRPLCGRDRSRPCRAVTPTPVHAVYSPVRWRFLTEMKTLDPPCWGL